MRVIMRPIGTQNKTFGKLTLSTYDKKAVSQTYVVENLQRLVTGFKYSCCFDIKYKLLLKREKSAR